MKVVILAGGFGTRLAEETDVIPKPMVEIGDKPILWHIMKHYSHFGFREFCVALGYKGNVIKRFFMDFLQLQNDMSLSLATGEVEVHSGEREDWILHLVDTGIDTMTGGRVGRLENLLKGERFMLTYGDGVSNVDLHDLLKFHESHGKIVTLTAVRPPARFGTMEFDENSIVTNFNEKSQTKEGWINGGFMVLEPQFFSYVKGDATVLERDVLERLGAEGQLAAYPHTGFWQCMDMLRDKQFLEKLWREKNAPWKTWE